MSLIKDEKKDDSVKGADKPKADMSDAEQKRAMKTAPTSVDAIEHQAKTLVFDCTIGHGPADGSDGSLEGGSLKGTAVSGLEDHLSDKTKTFMAAQKDPEKFGDAAKLKKGPEAKDGADAAAKKDAPAKQKELSAPGLGA